MSDDEAEFADAVRDAMALIGARLSGNDETADVILGNADLYALALALTDIAAGLLAGIHGSEDRAAEVTAAAHRAAVVAMEAEDDS